MRGVFDRRRLETIATKREEVRTELALKWLGAESVQWNPKCDVILYPTATSYLVRVKAVSVGSCLIVEEGDRVVGRTIDIRADNPEFIGNTLPHEITHAVIADRFGARPIPSWAGEGMSMRAESEQRQQRHLSDLRTLSATSGTFDLAELFNSPKFTSTSDQALF